MQNYHSLSAGFVQNKCGCLVYEERSDVKNFFLQKLPCIFDLDTDGKKSAAVNSRSKLVYILHLNALFSSWKKDIFV
jgi:hypothetical protein